jgi:ABC-2 type transport system permease protein
MGIFASPLPDNQNVAYLIGLVLSYILYYGFEALSGLFSDGSTSLFIVNMGMKAHFESVATGIMDTRNMLYFLSIGVFFLFLSVVQLNNHER